MIQTLAPNPHTNLKKFISNLCTKYMLRFRPESQMEAEFTVVIWWWRSVVVVVFVDLMGVIGIQWSFNVHEKYSA